MTSYDFGFAGYHPTWRPYEDARQAARDCLGKHVCSRLLDIRGVVAQEGWLSDWPIVLEFESGAVSINTKCDRDWAIDPWNTFPFRSEDEFNRGLSYASLLYLPNLERLKGKALDGVLWPANRAHGIVQCFLLRFMEHTLKVFDAGDQLGLSVIESSHLLTGTECINCRDVNVPIAVD